MNKFIFAFLVLSSFSAFAQDVENVEFYDSPPAEEPAPANEDLGSPIQNEFVPIRESSEPLSPSVRSEDKIENKDKFYVRKSRWVSTFGFEHLSYPTIYNFIGVKSKFKPNDKDLFGGRLGVGGEIYLGGGFVTRTMVEGYYVGTLFERVLNGGEEAAHIKFAFTKTTGQVYGMDASQSLGWMFDFIVKNPIMETYSYLTFEPFVEAGIGKAWAYNRLNYSYNLSPQSAPVNEAYKVRVEDDLLNARIGAGFNITAKSGFFMQFRATVNRFAVTERKFEGHRQPNGQTRTFFKETDDDAKIDPIVVYTLGGGYKF